MDQGYHNSSSSSSRQQQQQQQQQQQHIYHHLPPPSQLHHLPPPSSSFARSNTLPPISASASPDSPGASNGGGGPSPSYPPSRYHHPSLTTPTTPGILPSPSGHAPWPSLRARDDGGSGGGDYGMRDREYDGRGGSSRERGRSRDPQDRDPGASALPPRRRPDLKSSASSKLVDDDLDPQQHQPPPQSASSSGPKGGAADADDGMSATSDFVKKLYKMLEDNTFHHVVSWNQSGDAFVVKDMNEFTKSILPRMFKHSNFASFVRQLNKYDFHKVKNSDDTQYGEHSWTFRHPDFQADRREALENIKRKVPAQRKPAPASALPSSSNNLSSSSSSMPNGHGLNNPLANGVRSGSSPPAPEAVAALQDTVERLLIAQDEMARHIRHLESNYQSVLGEMVVFQRNMAQQDGLMQNLIQYFLQLENAKIKDAQAQIANNASSAVGVGAGASSSSSNSGSSSGNNNASSASQNRDGGSNQANGNSSNNNSNANNGGANSGGTFADANPFVVAREAQRMVLGAYGEDDVARASLEQLNEISRRAAVAGMVFNGNNSNNNNANGSGAESASDRLQNMLASVANANSNNSSGSGSASGPNGLAHLSREDTLQRIEELTRNRPSSANQRRADLRPFNSSTSSSSLSNGGGGGMNGLLLNGNGVGNNGQELLPPVVATAPGGGGQYANGSDPFIMPGQETTALEMYAHAANSSNSQSAQQQQQQQNGNNAGGYALTTMQAHQAQAHGLTHSGLQVFTLGHLMPKSALAGEDDGPGGPGGEQGPGMWSLGQQQQQQQGQGSPQSSTATYVSDGGNSAPSGISTLDDDFSSSAGAGPSNAGSSSSSASASSSSAGGGAGPVSRPGSAKLRVRRSTFVPGWAVPPRVLLVDDDAVNRRLSSKFLQVFGCTIDVAVDGVVAVNKMNLEKYDLVLMDIVMPKLDGITATSMIRQFDHMTPIISMTANSKPNEIMTYYSSGMNDILPKPFTKEGLLTMLERHLSHLKVIQQMAKVPRSVGIPPLSDEGFDQALQQQQQQQQDFDDEGGVGNMVNGMTLAKINPLAGMGLSDEEYAAMLQHMVSAGDFQHGGPVGVGKRALEDPGDEGGGKRSRFEVIE
ncbi:hypothetical protein SCHPADRAFT_871912 [Schizopora paradoxa]|uniref:Response regulatory domain-containing protein n=1 Tax=Schizopora paradoxa TaxID=27342 RepID=A0A0H2RSN6_9AGAM|nr:hypothetical protein SCHPADRAFT_871912 [Schizopora paradoxa]